VASTNDLKNGMVLKLDNDQLWSVVEFQHVKPGKGPAFVRTKLKHVLSGKVVDKTFNAGVKVETASVDKRGMQFSYKDGEDFVFMDMDTYDQIHIGTAVLGDAANYLLEGNEATVAMYEGRPCTSSCRPRSSWSSSTPSPASRATAPPAAPSPPVWRPATRSAFRCSSPPVRRSRSTPAPVTTSAG
jgi:translation elongation factor P/translation initiation factor 5A